MTEEKKKKDVVFKMFRAEIKAVDDKGEGVIDVLIPMSTGSVDRHGESIDPKGWKKSLKQFKKRAILLSSHAYAKLTNQIGELLDIQVVEAGLLAKPKYYINEGNEEADWGYKLALKGMAAFSVGFIPIKWEDSDGKDGKPSRTYLEQELVEISQVTVPSNRDAIQEMRSKSSDDFTNKLLDDVLEEDGLLIEIVEDNEKETSEDEEGEIELYEFESYKDNSGITRYRAEVECPECKKKRWVDRRNIEKENFTALCLECLNNSTGKDSNAYKDGRWNQSNGYIGILASLVEPEFQCMKDSRGYIYEHRYIMAKRMGRPLEEFEQVHHLNGIKDDNRLENLELVGAGEHLLITKMQTRIKELESEPIKFEDVEKPYPAEHSCRIRPPGDFKPDSFRRISRVSDGKKYSVIMGRLKGETTLTEQAYRYGIKVWTVSEARKHCKDHKGIAFEPATGKEEETDFEERFIHKYFKIMKERDELKNKVDELNEKIKDLELKIQEISDSKKENNSETKDGEGEGIVLETEDDKKDDKKTEEKDAGLIEIDDEIIAKAVSDQMSYLVGKVKKDPTQK